MALDGAPTPKIFLFFSFRFCNFENKFTFDIKTLSRNFFNLVWERYFFSSLIAKLTLRQFLNLKDFRVT